MSGVGQQLGFCETDDGVQLAYAVSGSGPVLVKAPNFLTHVEFDWDSPVWRHWMGELSDRFTLVRYDERGCGLSDLDVDRFTLDTWVADLEAVVAAAGVGRFPLLGVSAGGAIAIAYAAKHPERVTRLVLYGAYARGRFHRSDDPQDRREAELLLEMIRTGWGRANPAFRRVFTMLFMPEGTAAQLDWFDELQRITTPPENAARFERAFFDLDVTDLAKQLTVPTLVVHARGDAVCSFDGARQLAGLIPHSQFVPLDSRNHILLEHEPAWPQFLDAVDTFFARTDGAEPPDRRDHRLAGLTPREHQVLALIAAGASNHDIATRLVISPATVGNHITRIFRKLSVRTRAEAMVLARDGDLAAHRR